MTENTAYDYWINPKALSISENAMDDPDRITVSISGGAQIVVFIEGIIGYDNGHNYQRWPLAAYPTVFNSTSRKYVYAAIPRTLDVGNVATVVFPSEYIDVFGKALHDTDETDEEGNIIQEEVQVGDENFWYIFLGGILSSSRSESGAIVNREWDPDIDYGYLDSSLAINAGPVETDWYKYEREKGLVTFKKNLSMLFGEDQNVFLNFAIGNEHGFIPAFYDEKNKAICFDGNIYTTGEMSAYGAGKHSGGGGLSWEDLTTAGTQVIDKSHLPSDITAKVTWNNIEGRPTWIPSADPHYLTSVSWSNIQSKPSTFTPSVHSHTTSDITDIDTWINGKNFLTSVSWSNIQNVPTTISGFGITDAKIANGTITLGSNTITPLTADSTLNATKLTNTIPLTSIPQLTFAKMPTMYWADQLITSSANRGAAPTLGAIEFLGSDNGDMSHGGFIDFHFGKSTADYTARIIEWSDGLKVTFGDIPAERKCFFVENGELRIGNYILASTSDGLKVSHADTSKDANLYATGEVSAYGIGTHSGGGGLSWEDLTTAGTQIIDKSHLPSDITAKVTWSNIEGRPTWIPSADPHYLTSVSWSNIKSKPSTFTPSAHSHTTNDITDIDTWINGKNFLTSVSWSDLSDSVPVAKIPNISASKITSGQFSFDRLPTMYWANVAVGSEANYAATPTFGSNIKICGGNYLQLQFGKDMDTNNGLIYCDTINKHFVLRPDASNENLNFRIQANGNLIWQGYGIYFQGKGNNYMYHNTEDNYFHFNLPLYTENGKVRIGSYILQSTADGLQILHADSSKSANIYATGEVAAYKVGSGGLSTLNWGQLDNDNVWTGSNTFNSGITVSQFGFTKPFVNSAKRNVTGTTYLSGIAEYDGIKDEIKVELGNFTQVAKAVTWLLSRYTSDLPSSTTIGGDSGGAIIG